MDTTRRKFLKKAGYGALGVLGLSQLGLLACSNAQNGEAGTADSTQTDTPPAAKSDVGIQLYTVRDDMNTDVKATLQKVANIGYNQLELAGYSEGKFYGFAPKEFKKMVEDLGMKVLSSHTGISIENGDTSVVEQLAEAHAEVGAEYCIKPWLPEKQRKSIASYQQIAEELNQIGEILAKHKIQFGYHNHDFEFQTIDGKIPYYDVLLPQTDPQTVVMEIDLYWAKKAGQDPVEIFERFPGRFALWHVKDMDNTDEQFFAPVGDGVIDFKKIFQHKDRAGMKYFFVEQDRTKNYSPLESIEISYNNLTNKILI